MSVGDPAGAGGPRAHVAAEGEDSIAALARELAALRGQRGSPTWAAMERRAHLAGYPVGKSSLNDVVQGSRLPSHRVLEGFLAALGIDAGQWQAWLTRRDTLAAGSRQNPMAAVTPAAERPEATTPPRPRWPWLVASHVLVALLTAALVWFVARPEEPVVVTGANPENAGCAADAVTVKVVTTERLQLELRFSQTCQALWARVARLDNDDVGNQIQISVYRLAEGPTGPSTQSSVDLDSGTAHTTLIVRADGDDRICAVGSVTEGGVVHDSGEPVCG